jgi:hypothetical protein
MKCKIWWIQLCAVLLVAASACSRKPPAPQVIVEVPSGFSGNFLLEMEVKEAPPLEKRGDTYVVTVAKSGTASTSTVLTHVQPTFHNSGEGAIWGYSHAVFTTGDGIPVGGKIEFFVGTRKDYDAEESRKNHSREFSNLPESAT